MFKRFNYLLLLLTTVLISSCVNGGKDSNGCSIPEATNYNENATNENNCDCEYNGITPSCGTTNPTELNIDPVLQETEVWCWLAVGEMIFKHYGLPTVNGAGDYQCGIVGAVGYASNGACDECAESCGNCIRPAGDPEVVTFMLNNYPKVACRNLYINNQTLKNEYTEANLSEDLVVNELDHFRPIIAGVNPGTQLVLPGQSRHVALIVGYYYDLLNNLILKVNDPYPYASKGYFPYQTSGGISNGDLSYEISYDNFVNGLKWNTSWYNVGW